MGLFRKDEPTKDDFLPRISVEATKEQTGVSIVVCPSEVIREYHARCRAVGGFMLVQEIPSEIDDVYPMQACKLLGACTFATGGPC